MFTLLQYWVVVSGFSPEEHDMYLFPPKSCHPRFRNGIQVRDFNFGQFIQERELCNQLVSACAHCGFSTVDIGSHSCRKGTWGRNLVGGAQVEEQRKDARLSNYDNVDTYLGEQATEYLRLKADGVDFSPWEGVYKPMKIKDPALGNSTVRNITWADFRNDFFKRYCDPSNILGSEMMQQLYLLPEWQIE
jgi:hypothetical protein